MKTVAPSQPVSRPENFLLNEASVQQARVFTRNSSLTVEGLPVAFVAGERQLRQGLQHYAEVSGVWNRFEEAHGSFADEHSTR
ncbi:MAG: type II toxin-antitoxin system CcdA family antitoxin [Dechloromonas sp.]|nr:type II toxin-antitoxin system CcdA family antitoxin [Dechloromonas sp.]